jgi:hypothetical protein
VKNSIYIVRGHTRQYTFMFDDPPPYEESWLVRAFPKSEQAQRYADDCNKIAKELIAKGNKHYKSFSASPHPLDRLYRCCGEVIEYFVEELPFGI